MLLYKPHPCTGNRSFRLQVVSPTSRIDLSVKKDRVTGKIKLVLV